MMSKRKVLAVLLSVMLCALLLVACGNPEEPAETQPTTETTGVKNPVKTDPFETEPTLGLDEDPPLPELDEDPLLPPEPDEGEFDPDWELPEEPTRPAETTPATPEVTPTTPEVTPTEPEEIVPPTTQPTEPGEEPVLDENELPLVPAY